MSVYVGIDVHGKRSQVAVVDQAGMCWRTGTCRCGTYAGCDIHATTLSAGEMVRGRIVIDAPGGAVELVYAPGLVRRPLGRSLTVTLERVHVEWQ